MTAAEKATEDYERLARACQSEARVPALSVAVHRADRPLWTMQVGSSGTDRPLDAETQFRLGSVTKTFTATLVMQARDDGLLDLDDRVDAHLDVPAHGDLTLRRMLSHTSGLQREPFGDLWDGQNAPEDDQMLADLARAERVLGAGRQFHYSNLAYAMLGRIVAKLRGGTWAEVLTDRILDPLGLSSITVDPTERAAIGYMVEAYSDHAWAERPMPTGAIGPAGQLWGTAGDLAKWAGFLVDPATVDPDGAVLAASTLEEMRWPVTTMAETLWAAGWGLGLMLFPQQEPHLRVMHVGHTGAMPGFLSGVFGRTGGARRPKALAAVSLGSSGTAGEICALPHALLRAAVELDPADVEVWQVGPPTPSEFASVLGPWWSEGSQLLFSWRSGALSCRYAESPAGAPASVFEPIAGEADVLRCVAGPERGERLILNRDAGTGDVVEMRFATYLVTRTQQPFKEL